MRLHCCAVLLLACALPVVAGAQRREVEVTTSDHAALRATYFPAPAPGPGAIIFRNCDQDRHALDSLADRLAARGVHVVTYEYRPGLAAGMSWSATRAADARAIHDWLVAQRGVDGGRLATIGGSCGVAMALDHARAVAPAVKAAIVMSGPADDDARAFVRRSPWFSVLGIASRAENSEQNIVPITSASTNAASRLIVLDVPLHGTNMITKSADTERAATEWLLSRLAKP
jgi:hypothetical protein